MWMGNSVGAATVSSALLLWGAGCGDTANNQHDASSSNQSSSNSGGAGNTSPTSGGSSTPIPVQDLCPVFTNDLCVYLMDCNGARYRDLDHCRQELDCFGLSQLEASAASGAVDYDPSLVGECHERFIASPCSFGFFLFTPDIYDVLAFCPGTITPNLGAGDSCVSDGECQPGLYCNKTNNSCPGTCQAHGVAGDSCEGGGRCADGFDCGADSLCEPEKQAGDACDVFDYCNYSVSCLSGEVCPENIWCDLGLGQCQLGRLEGEPCGQQGDAGSTWRAECAINLFCDALDFNQQGTCRPRGAVGDPCNDETYSCASDLHCVGFVPGQSLGTCSGPSAAGSDCDTDDDCQRGLVCIDRACGAPSELGQLCYSSRDCAPGLVCASADLVCVQARYPGDACSETEPCSFSRCVDGSCAHHAGVGEPCAAAADCATGECVAGTCYDDSVCAAPE